MKFRGGRNPADDMAEFKFWEGRARSVWHARARMFVFCFAFLGPAGAAEVYGFWTGALPLINLSAVMATGCGPSAQQIQATTADAVARSANAGLPVLVEAERQQGLLAIQASPDRETARAKLVEIEHEWAPVWTAWKALAVAQGAWATALEHGGGTEAAALGVRDAFCKLRAIPLAAKHVPEAPGLCPAP